MSTEISENTASETATAISENTESVATAPAETTTSYYRFRSGGKTSNKCGIESKL